MKKNLRYQTSFIIIAIALLLNSVSVFGADNFLINGQKNATVAVHDSFTVSFDFGQGDTLAHVLLWIDVNRNGVIDSLVDMPAYSSEQEGEPLIDGGMEDQDFQKNGSFLMTITDFWNIADVEYIFVVYDQSGSDMAHLMVEQITSTYSISGNVEEPPNQPFLYIEVWPAPMYPEQNAKANQVKSYQSNNTLNSLPARSIFAKQATNEDNRSFATFTDSTGAYTVYVPDDMAQDWNVSTFDFWGLIPGYVPPESQIVWVDGMITDVNFSYYMSNVLVEGNVLDYAGQPLIDDYGNPLQYGVGAQNHQNGMWVEAEVDSSHYRLHLTDGDFDIIVYNVMPHYLRPYEQHVMAASCDTLQNMDFALYPADAMISGRVTEFGTNPVPYAEIIGFDESSMYGFGLAQTDMDGYYSLPVSSQSPTWNLYLNMEHFPPDKMVEGGNSRMASPGDEHVDFNIIRVLPEPKIEFIKDIPHDQGLQVRVAWKGSAYDTRDFHGMPITQYSVWRLTPRRMIPEELPASLDDSQKLIEKSPLERLSDYGKNLPKQLEGQNYIWDFMTTVPAIKLPMYSYVSPTLGDSTAHGIFWSYYVVVAHSGDYYSYFHSEIDSGYSVDNMAPPAPEVIAEAVPMAIELRWNVNPHPDVTLYSLYRSDTPGFSPSNENLIGATEECFFRDENVTGVQTLYYRVGVEDDAMNHSFSEEVFITSTDVNSRNQNEIPETYELGGNFPNPFNPATEISFQIPKDGNVKIVVYNVLGEKVKTLTNQNYKAGYYHIPWRGDDDLGNSVFSGIYFYHMKAGEYKASGKMILVR